MPASLTADGAQRSEVVRCITGIVTHAVSGMIPDLPCIASGKRKWAYGSSSVSQ